MRWITVLMLFTLPAACGHLPGLQPLKAPLSSHAQTCCNLIYPQGEWQLVHAIEAVLPDGGRHTLMGITQVSSPRRTLHCVLMTLEGMVMFEARFDGRVEVLRALPPFDARGFAQGIIDDIMLILLAPTTAPQEVGHLSRNDQDLVCRWHQSDGSYQDNVFHENVCYTNQGWEIRRYNDRRRLVRRIVPLDSGGVGADNQAGRGRTGAVPNSAPMASVVALKAFGMIGYRLTLTLLDAQPLASANTRTNEKASP